MRRMNILSAVIGIVALIYCIAIITMTTENEVYEEQGHAFDAFEWWYAQRALPGNTIPKEGLTRAFLFAQQSLRTMKKRSVSDPWESIGPSNIGGRVLSLALDPDSAHVLWAGSASGGLWRSRTGGAGTQGWDYVNTGFYLLSVSSIAINPKNANEMYVGTGEISGYNLGQVGTPGARTTYGLGIIKSTDRGATWIETGLTWKFDQNRSVQKVLINPKNPKTIFAATSEGTFRSYDAGATFQRVDSTLMAMDVTMNTSDTSIVLIACGQRNTAPNDGLYRSTNGGSTFQKVTAGIPAANFGRTSLAVAPSDPSIMYASIADAVTHNVAGLYRSTNSGASWELRSTVNYLNGQGWYNNICAVHPQNPNIVYAAGLDIYYSTTGGTNLLRRSYWYNGFEGVIAPGGKEGYDDYAHADHHTIVFDPSTPARMFFGTDGGVFETTDGGFTYSGRNGGFVTTQFYNGFATALNDSLVALGGLQDNGTVKWEGNNAWRKVYGGDGGWCAIDPENTNILYEEYVYLSIAKSTDGGQQWTNIYTGRSDSANFIAPFVLSPSHSSVLYAGTKHVIKSTNGGASWFTTNGGSVLNGTNISCIGVSWTSPESVIVATGQRYDPMKFEIFRTTNGGSTWSKSSSSLPVRFPTDISFDHQNSAIAYLTYSGYGSPHIYKTTDAGTTWHSITADLPDVPVQSVCTDPSDGSSIFAGTDLGVYHSSNGGASWNPWFDGMPFAMITDLSVSPMDRRLRASTFGNGVYQRRLPENTTEVGAEQIPPVAFELFQNYPNPFNPMTTIVYVVPERSIVSVSIYDVSGRKVETLLNRTEQTGRNAIQWDGSAYASGTYFCRLTVGNKSVTRKMILTK